MNESEPVAAAKKAAKPVRKRVVAKVAALAKPAVQRLRRSAPIAPATKIERIAEVSFSLSEAVATLSTVPALLTRRLRNRKLYGFRISDMWFLPKFQFRGKRIIPGIERVVPQLDPHLHPLEVVNWFTSRHSDLVIHGDAVSPVTWLASGGDAGKVANLAKEVGSGL